MTVTDEMIEAGAEALKTVPNYWTRFNYANKDGFKYEICRYGVGKEPEIVVVEGYDDERRLRVAQERIIRTERARAVLESAFLAAPPSDDYRRGMEDAMKAVHEHAERIERAEEALTPFADEAEGYEPFENDDEQEAWDLHVTLGDLRRARAALAKIKEIGG